MDNSIENFKKLSSKEILDASEIVYKDHYYNYIDDSLQKPIHVLNDRGIPTREMNRKIFEK